jgi:hypothetical protein
MGPARERPCPRSVSRLSAAIPHAASRRITALRPASCLSRAEVVLSKAAEGRVKGCGWHGMQGVRGSNPLSSTPGQRPSLPSTAGESPASGSKSAAACPERPIQRPARQSAGQHRWRRRPVDPARRWRPRVGDEGPDRLARQDRSQTGELTSSLSGFCTRARSPPSRGRPAQTVYRWRPLEPLGSDGMWTRRGPDPRGSVVRQAWIGPSATCRSVWLDAAAVRS